MGSGGGDVRDQVARNGPSHLEPGGGLPPVYSKPRVVKITASKVIWTV